MLVTICAVCLAWFALAVPVALLTARLLALGDRTRHPATPRSSERPACAA